MTIKWYETDDGIPIPVKDGIVLDELFLFMHYLATTPSKRGGKRKLTTLSNVKWQIKMWFDYLDDHEPSLDFKEARYSHLQTFKDTLLNDPDDPITSDSYNQYYNTWRSFYDYCKDKAGISTLMRFPAKIESSRNRFSNKHSDLLAHTRSGYGAKPKHDPGMEVVQTRTDKLHHFINLNQFKTLSNALGTIDPVYEAIGHAMLQTGLRIGGAFQIPSGPTQRNPYWQRAAELVHDKKEYQEFTYMPKGGKVLTECLFATETMQFIHDIYIKPHFEERSKKYEEKHGEMPPNNLLWLNENGKPILYHDVANAFREASKVIGFKVTSHYLRHTFATYVVWNWFRANDIQPSVKYTNDVFYALKDQLGHSHPSSTEVYIRTILRVKATAWLPKLVPSLKEKAEKHMAAEVQEQINSVFFSRATTQAAEAV